MSTQRKESWHLAGEGGRQGTCSGCLRSMVSLLPLPSQDVPSHPDCMQRHPKNRVRGPPTQVPQLSAVPILPHVPQAASTCTAQTLWAKECFVRGQTGLFLEDKAEEDTREASAGSAACAGHTQGSTGFCAACRPLGLSPGAHKQQGRGGRAREASASTPSLGHILPGCRAASADRRKKALIVFR